MGFPLDKEPFVAIEGLDGAGTTTQARRVAQALRARGQAVSVSCEPSEGPVGALIRQMLSGRVTVPGEEGPRRVGDETLALLFAADRLDHLEAEVRPALASGQVAISDRYVHSSLVYQGEEGDDWVGVLNKKAPMPDITVYLEASVDLVMERLSERGRRDIYESRETLERLERRYDQVMSKLEEAGERILRVGAEESRETITEAIVDAIEEWASGV